MRNREIALRPDGSARQRIFYRTRKVDLMTIIRKPRREHEALAANAIRWRRIENGEPCAAYVLDAWRQRQRIAKSVKDKGRLHRSLKVV